MIVTVLAVLTLHTLDGREMYINPSHIVSVAKAPPSGSLPGANCVITLSNGKFLSVAEDCAEIIRRLKNE